MDKGATKEPITSTLAWDELEEWTRGRIQEWMQQLLVEEVTEFLGRRKYQRRGAEMAGYRNGYGKPRRLTMRSGTVMVRRPRVRWGCGARCATSSPGPRSNAAWNHRVVNLLTQVPKQRQGEARELLTKIPYQTNARQAQQKKRVFQNWCLEHGYERAAELIEENWEQMVGFYRFPRAHWRHLRTSNVVESPFAALRLRTDAAKRFKKVANATAVVWKMLLLAERKFRCITHRLTEPPNGLLKEYRTPACAAKWHTTSKRCSAQSAATEAASVRSRC